MGYGNTEIFLSEEERDALISLFLGKTVAVEIDRPIGYVHETKGVTLHYTLNYGYLPGVTGGDGEEQDVYVLGVSEPLERFEGRIIGAVRRSDDNEDKLVAAPDGVYFHQAQIAQAVHFVEQYFESTIESLYQKSCGVIPFRRHNGETELLLLLQKENGFWSFPKGHMKFRETEQDTALRELWEETGLTVQLQPDFREAVEYRISPLTRKEVVLFLGKADGTPIADGEEIMKLRWVSLPEAKRCLGTVYAPVLDHVLKFLEERGERNA